MRFINTERVIAVQVTTQEENPFVTDDSRLMDVWFDGAVVRKQFFKKVKKSEQENFIQALLERGFVQSGNLFLAPQAVHFAEMEHEIVGGVVTIGYQDDGKPVELKVDSKAFTVLCTILAGKEVKD